MKKTRLSQMQDQMVRKLGEERGGRISQAMEQEFAVLCQNDGNKPKDMVHHLHNNIYPVVAAYRTLMADGMAQEEASELAQSAFLELMEEPKASIQKLCRIPGVYRLIPLLFEKLMPVLFKKEAGFEFVYHPTNHRRARFDMLACPYLQACQELHCTELAPVFCATDDMCYGHMHPRLHWKRTKTLARGGDLCDFDLELR